MKLLIVVAVAVLLIGCEGGRDFGDKTNSYDTVCLNGVKYYSAHRLLAPVFNTSGKIVLCKY
jgi:hypothetical protein